MSNGQPAPQPMQPPSQPPTPPPMQYGEGAKEKKPFYKRWWFIAIVVIILFFIIVGIVGGDGDENSTNPGADEVQQNQQVADDESNNVAESPESAAPEPTEPKSIFPAFDSQSFSGTGDDVVDIELSDPAVITFSCPACERNVIVRSDNDYDTVVVNAIGSYSGKHVVNYRGGKMTQLTVSADSDWTMEVTDLNHLELIGGPTKGTGSSAFLYVGDASAAKFTHDGEANFIVDIPENETFVTINEIGPYEGTVPVTVSPVIITADGNWTFTPRK